MGVTKALNIDLSILSHGANVLQRSLLGSNCILLRSGTSSHTGLRTYVLVVAGRGRAL